MFEAHCIDKKTKRYFLKIFWDVKEYVNFITKCKYSKNIEIISTVDNSKYYD